MIGVMGYVLIQGLEENRVMKILVPIIYFINLDLNLSLPIFLSIISIFMIYIIVQNSFLAKTKCYLCKSIFIVIMVDVSYLLFLIGYDFIFQTQSVILDELLIYSLIVDLILAMIL
jgi:hypothetical protein